MVGGQMRIVLCLTIILSRRFATTYYRTAKGLFDHLVGAELDRR
jgi:hypothetical protein